jgi:DNA-binding CsgD family transcriptional regulator
MGKENRLYAASQNIPPMRKRWIFRGFPGAFEEEFRREDLRLSMNLSRFSMISGGLTIVCFALADKLFPFAGIFTPWAKFTPLAAVFFDGRTYVIPLFSIVCFIATFVVKSPPFVNMLKCLYVVVYAVGILGWMAFSAYDSPVYSFHFMSLVTLTVWLTIGGRVHFPYVTATCALIVGMYMVASLGFNRLLDTRPGTLVFVYNFIFLLASELFSLAANFSGEYYRRNIFLFRKQIRAEEEEARRKAFEKWKEAYLKFRDFNTTAYNRKKRPAPETASAENTSAAEKMERVKNDRLAELLDTFSGRNKTGHVFDRILDFVLEIAGSPRGVIAIRNERTGEPVYIVRRGIEHRDTAFVSGILAETFSAGVPITVNPALNRGAAAHREAALAHGVRSWLCFPVELQGVAIGACYLDKGWSDDEFSGEPDELIISLVTQVVLSVDGSDWRDEGPPPDIDMAGFNTQCEKLKFTPRERQLALLVTRGFSKRKICNKLFISVNTLRTHLKNINNKAGVAKRSELLSRLRGDVSN